MGSQQLNLKWRNHHSNLLSVFDKLLCTETLSDVTLACEGVTLKAHKMILSACSPFFHNLFTEHPNNHPIVILKDVHYRDLKAVVDFMYRGEVNISQDQLPSVLQTAELLRVKGLAESTERNSDQNMHHVRQTSEALKRRKRPRMPSGPGLHENGNIPQFPKIMQGIQSPAPQGVLLPVNQPKVQFPSDSGTSQSCSNWAASTETAELVEVNMNIESDVEKDSQKTRSDSASVHAAESQSPKGIMLGALESVVKLEEPDDDDDDDTSDCPSNFSLQNKSLQDSFPHSSPNEYQLQGFKPPDQPDIDAPHELARLPRHKKKDCVVCGNRKEGMRRRSRQWCPGCNVGVHVHCFDQLVHYRRLTKTRKTDGIPSLPCLTQSSPCVTPSSPCVTPSSPCVTPSPPSIPPSLPCVTWKPQDGSYLLSPVGFPAVFGFISPAASSPKARVTPSRSPCQPVRVSPPSLTQFPISEDVIGRCARIDPQKFVNDLMTELYTEEYLASHSVTGQKCPYKDSAQKPGINPVELAHIIRTVQGAFMHRSLSDTEIKACIRIKLGNASKLYARRKQNL